MDWLPIHTHPTTRQNKRGKLFLILFYNLKFLLYLNLKSLLDNAVDKKIQSRKKQKRDLKNKRNCCHTQDYAKNGPVKKETRPVNFYCDYEMDILILNGRPGPWICPSLFAGFCVFVLLQRGSQADPQNGFRSHTAFYLGRRERGIEDALTYCLCAIFIKPF